MTENMELWDQVCKTDPGTTKKVTTRGGFTAVNAQSQLKKATELWGPYGSTWGVRELQWSYHEGAICLDALFQYPKGSFSISVDMPFKPNDDCRKKLLTEARSKALSSLGFNSDVFEGQYDDSRYVSEMEHEYGAQAFVTRAEMAIRGATTLAQLDKCLKHIESSFTDRTFSDVVVLATLRDQVKAREAVLE